VLGNEILHGVIGKELSEFGTELGGKGLVVRQHQRGSVDLLNYICYGKGLTRTGNTEERLHARAAIYSADKRIDRFGLIARRLIFTFEYEFIHSGHLPLPYTPFYIVPQLFL